jgi:hypothetical protein
VQKLLTPWTVHEKRERRDPRAFDLVNEAAIVPPTP